MKNILLITVILLIVHALFTVLLCAIQEKNLEKRIIKFFVIIGLMGYGTFWAFYFGKITGYIAVITQITCVFYRARHHLTLDTHRLLKPVLLASIILALLGLYPYSGMSTQELAGHRWLSLPGDNWIPKILLNQVWEGNILRPMMGDWLSSDRPPLQAGIALFFQSIGIAGSWAYQGVGMYLQCLILFGIIPFWQLLGIQKHIALLSTGLVFSSLFLIHAVFVWPKLLAASYIILLYVYLNIDKDLFQNNTIPGWFWGGALMALAMLSHGGSAFALIAIVLAAFITRPWKGIRTIKALGMSVCLYLPWVLYQRLIDPPGDRLLKWHIGGYVPPTNDSLLTVILNSYKNLSFNAWWEAKLGNFSTVFSSYTAIPTYLYELLASGFKTNITLPMVVRSFFEFSTSLWLLWPIGILCFAWLLIRQRCTSELIRLTLVTLFGLLLWCILMFEKNSAVIHQGTFFFWLSTYTILISCILKIFGNRWTTIFVVFNSSLIVFTFLFATHTIILAPIAIIGAYLVAKTYET